MSITVRESNLYQNGQVIEYDNGDKELEREIILFPGEEEDQYHPVKAGDELTKLAYHYYKDFTQDPGKYWWVIADANDIENPLDLSEYIGSEIVIPAFQKFKLNNE